MIGNKLKELRLNKKFTLEELANKLNELYPHTVNFNKGKLSKWENGKEEPKLSSVRILADYYNISIDSLYKETNEDIYAIYNQLEKPRQSKVYKYAEHQLEEQNKKVAFNVYGQVAAGPALEYDDSEVETHYVESVPATADMALTISGKSMEPSFPNGSIVFYKRQPQVEHGEIAIVEIDGNAVTCKKVCYDYDNKKIILQSLNDKYEDMIFDDDQIRILGKVVK